MFKRILFAAVVLSFCATSSYAQQVFVSFGQGADVSSSGEADVMDGTGTAFIYSAGDFDIDAFDLRFSTADDSVIQFANAEIFNSEINANNTFLGVRWDGEPIGTVDNTTSGRFFGVTIIESGPDPALAAFDEDFDPLAANPDGRPGGSFLLGQVDYDIVGPGTADITLEIGPLEFFSYTTPTILLRPTLGSGTLSVTAVPEPSTMGLLALGLVGLVTRRSR